MKLKTVALALFQLVPILILRDIGTANQFALLAGLYTIVVATLVLVTGPETRNWVAGYIALLIVSLIVYSS